MASSVGGIIGPDLFGNLISSGHRSEVATAFVIGAVVMAKVEQKVLDEKLLRGWLEEALTRADDRALFGLPPR